MCIFKNGKARDHIDDIYDSNCSHGSGMFLMVGCIEEKSVAFCVLHRLHCFGC